MIVKAGFLIVALVSVVKVRQITSKLSRKPSTSEHGKPSSQEEQTEKENGKFEESHVNPRKKEKQAKTYKSKSVDHLDSNRQEYSVQNYNEIDLLKNIVKEKEKMRENLEIRLLELYCLKEHQSRISLLQKQLKDRTSEVDMLREKINGLQAERRKLYEEVKLNQLVAEQLESEKLTLLELQGQIEFDSGPITMLKEKVSGFCMEGESQVPNKVDKKLKAIKVLELKALEIKRRNIELQLEKRDLVVNLNAAKSKIAELSAMTERKLVGKHKEEICRLRDVNKNLTEQVDKLHRDRLSILEELVYQRWLNTCLRFELEDYRSPSPKKTKPNVCRKLDFSRSDSYSSGISSVESEEVTNTTTTSSSGSENTNNKKKGLLQIVKKWGRSKDNSSANASDRRSFPSKAGKIRRFSTSSMPSSISGLRNRGDSGILFPLQEKEAADSKSPEMPATRRVRRVSFNDSINSVRYINDDSPESDQGISEIGQKNAENFDDCSSTVNDQSHEDSADLGSQDSIETQVVSRKGTVQVECLSSAMPIAASEASKFGELVNLIAAFLIVFFLVLVYLRVFFSFKAKW
ncbi:hypothetical protein ACH5RR_008608 [Cinchona calisaya]|uniref:Protein CHUP1, chloroplastic-like n=1 Tax=Cinchona calisaya TaxID=153742 RepID=A0ABD3AEC6_9GENT